jgi:hypothetical protein
LPAIFGLVNYTSLQSLKLENVQDAKLVPRILKQITSTEIKHLFMDWGNGVRASHSYNGGSGDGIDFGNKYPCDWYELGDILAGAQFSNLLKVEIQFYVDNVYDKQALVEAEADVRRCMPPRNGQGVLQLRFEPLPSYDQDYFLCGDW